ncbi:CTIMC, partial [Symbiodinium microadriaticum]
VVIATPTLHLQTCKQLLRSDIAVSSQDVGFKTGYGAFTGEHSADMLIDSGINWTLTGTIIRNMSTSDLQVPLLLQLADREKGITMDVCAEQLNGIKNALATGDWKKVVIAYEPVWAIGTGVTASPEQAQETHAEIRQWIAKNVSAVVAEETRIIYGGSANAKNCNELFAKADINGFLVGGASLKAEFVDIINCTQKK